mmetsp:Transcript_6051/g.15597  ORF Transcript_6051/g.15597 Transcript_6051/m.15597 type:complete len:289 (-) Transcript_6051:228-1094(-)|eukprot:jgi/Tetstr1/460958/TSEL_006110.t1
MASCSERSVSSSGRAPPGQTRIAAGAEEPPDDADDYVALPTSKLLFRWTAGAVSSQVQQGAKAAVIVSCGSFNPVTVQHLRNLELARYSLREASGCCVLGGFLSPVSGSYKKPCLARAEDRVRLAEAAVVDSDWIAVDRWESAQPSYVRTLHVLASIEEEVNHALRKRAGGSAPPVQVFLLCGADMLSAMNDEKVWDRTLLRSLLSKYEIVCVGRTGVDTSEITREGTVLHEFKAAIHFIQDPFSNDISSTKVREELQHGRPVDYIVPDKVLNLIRAEKLYGVAPSYP